MWSWMTKRWSATCFSSGNKGTLHWFGDPKYRRDDWHLGARYQCSTTIRLPTGVQHPGGHPAKATMNEPSFAVTLPSDVRRGSTTEAVPSFLISQISLVGDMSAYVTAIHRTVEQIANPFRADFWRQYLPVHCFNCLPGISTRVRCATIKIDANESWREDSSSRDEDHAAQSLGQGRSWRAIASPAQGTHSNRSGCVIPAMTVRCPDVVGSRFADVGAVATRHAVGPNAYQRPEAATAASWANGVVLRHLTVSGGWPTTAAPSGRPFASCCTVVSALS